MINLKLQDRVSGSANPGADAAGAIWRPKVVGEVHVLFAGVESYNVISHHFAFK